MTFCSYIGQNRASRRSEFFGSTTHEQGSFLDSLVWEQFITKFSQYPPPHKWKSTSHGAPPCASSPQYPHPRSSSWQRHRLARREKLSCTFVHPEDKYRSRARTIIPSKSEKRNVQVLLGTTTHFRCRATL